MSPIRAKMQAIIDELIQVNDIALFPKADADLFSGYQKAVTLARVRQPQLKQEAFALMQFEAMKSTVGGSE